MSHLLFHGSATWLPVGTVLRPSLDYEKRWGHTDFYRVLERYRPAQCLAHAASVFLCDSDDVLDAAGGGAEWVFKVKPLEPVSGHDLNLSSGISAASSQGQGEAVLAHLARRYWAGSASEDPLWEYLTCAAEIITVEAF